MTINTRLLNRESINRALEHHVATGAIKQFVDHGIGGKAWHWSVLLNGDLVPDEFTSKREIAILLKGLTSAEYRPYRNVLEG